MTGDRGPGPVDGSRRRPLHFRSAPRFEGARRARGRSRLAAGDDDEEEGRIPCWSS